MKSPFSFEYKRRIKVAIRALMRTRRLTGSAVLTAAQRLPFDFWCHNNGTFVFTCAQNVKDIAVRVKRVKRYIAMSIC